MATLDSTIALIQTAVGAVTGVAYAPANPLDQASYYPFITTFPATFTSKQNTPEEIDAYKFLRLTGAELFMCCRSTRNRLTGPRPWPSVMKS
jgi:hypothetical protein